MADKKCEKCIHYEVCKSEMDLAPDDTLTFFPYNEDCPHFKNKSDYAEVKHGKWKWGKGLGGQYGIWCTNCGAGWIDSPNAEWIALEHDYCGKCGAKMDGKDDL